MVLVCVFGGPDRSHVGVDVLLPHAQAGKYMSRHMQGVGGRRRDGRVLFCCSKPFTGQLGAIAGVNDVVRETGMVWMRLEAWFEHSESLPGIADRILLPNGGSERQTVECLGLHVIRVSSV